MLSHGWRTRIRPRGWVESRLVVSFLSRLAGHPSKGMAMTGRFDRQIALFGEEGQAKVAAATVAVVGVGGLGSHLVQQLALLGVRQFALIDCEELADTNRNRYVTARF